jgi:hypothetical protein
MWHASDILGFTGVQWYVWSFGRSLLNSQIFILDQVKKRSCVLHSLVNRHVKVGKVENVVEHVQAKMRKIGGLAACLKRRELADFESSMVFDFLLSGELRRLKL